MHVAEHPYPAALRIDTPERIARWRPLVQWFLAIPHLLITYALQYLSQIIAIVSWFVVLFTGKLPSGFAGIQRMYLRYYNRTYAYTGFLTTNYPPFAFQTPDPDPGDYVEESVDFQVALEDRNRLTVFFRIVLFIPQFIVLVVLGFVAGIVHLIAFFAVIITGRWPESLRSFIVGYMRWSLRVSAYMTLLTDEYSPFSLSE